MKKPLNLKYYPRTEENLNIISHAAGLVFGLIGLIMLQLKAAAFNSAAMTISFGIYGFTLVMLYAASTFYHLAKEPKRRFRLKVFDHISIFLLIAGTYTPFAMVSLQGKTGWIVFGITWGIAFFGTILKIFFTGRYKLLSTLLYVGMGWIIVFAIEPLMENLETAGLWWMLGGGIAYTIGAILYSISRIKYNHALFHLFVLLGSFCHFWSIYFYVFPKE